MKNIKILLSIVLLLGLSVSCKKELDIQNPNQPTVGSANSESGIIALAQGGVYVNGFRSINFGGFSGTFFGDGWGYHEIMADVLAAEAANQRINEIGCPNYVITDNGTKIINPNSPTEQTQMLREVNINANASDNPIVYEWAYMYGLNTACNNILGLVDGVTFTGDANAKKGVLKAWAYWWKGYAYARIGSIYYAGIINDAVSGTNNKYVTKEDIIKESNKNLDAAAAALNGLAAGGEYSKVLGALIPDFFQVGKGGVLTPDMWKRNINTMKARNILVNTRSKDMTPAQWSAILDLTNNGIKAGDLVFTGRSNATADFISATGNTPASQSVGATNVGVSYRISERFIQEFKTGDKRLENNFNNGPAAPWIGNSDRGNVFNTRWGMVGNGKGLPGVIFYGSRDVGAYELYLASTYEENEITKAEALINSGKIEDGLKVIDAIRTLQGAGLAPVAGTSLSLAAAKEELRRERRVVLPFRGLSFYDARRWGVIDDISKGGGRTNAVVLDKFNILNTKATINYNYLDYWDVPDNELAYNVPGAGSAAVKNPK
ncbi:RagB/SusD family nutrient uptake outer membrane protein [Haliscomenobacter sp.]|uniref:RagB/SusD family nutrient uptake outer membrane protein n=1 Tax=Haliscomenobacter sp. TaxID=2717303 RepID=UPI003364BD83